MRPSLVARLPARPHRLPGRDVRAGNETLVEVVEVGVQAPEGDGLMGLFGSKQPVLDEPDVAVAVRRAVPLDALHDEAIGEADYGQTQVFVAVADVQVGAWVTVAIRSELGVRVAANVPPRQGRDDGLHG